MSQKRFSQKILEKNNLKNSQKILEKIPGAESSPLDFAFDVKNYQKKVNFKSIF